MDWITGTFTKSIAFCLQILSSITTFLLGEGNPYLYVWLFSSNTQITPTTPLSSLTEATFSGYARQQVTAFGPAGVDQSGIPYVPIEGIIFANNGGGVGNNIFSAALIAAIPGGTTATATVTTTAGVISAPVVTAGGGGYTSPPTVHVLGGGANAVVTATLTAGVVTSLTVVNGGTGYADATLVIDPPIQIIAFLNLSSPAPMNVGTDLLPLAGQLNITA